MTTNDILKRLRYALDLKDMDMLDLLTKGKKPTAQTELDTWFADEGSPGFAECPQGALVALLDGLILAKRGPSDHKSDQIEVFDNNLVLKKLRIALELHEEDLVTIMKRSNVEVSKNELTALFRNRNSKNYRECMDQFLRNFLAGLAAYRRSRR